MNTQALRIFCKILCTSYYYLLYNHYNTLYVIARFHLTYIQYLIYWIDKNVVAMCNNCLHLAIDGHILSMAKSYFYFNCLKYALSKFSVSTNQILTMYRSEKPLYRPYRLLLEKQINFMYGHTYLSLTISIRKFFLEANDRLKEFKYIH